MDYMGATGDSFRILKRVDEGYWLYLGQSCVSKLWYFEEVWTKHDLALDRLLPALPTEYPQGLFLSARGGDRLSVGPFGRVGVHWHLELGVVVTLTAFMSDRRRNGRSPVAPFLAAIAEEVADNRSVYVDGPHWSDGVTSLTIGSRCEKKSYGENLDVLSAVLREAVEQVRAEPRDWKSHFPVNPRPKIRRCRSVLKAEPMALLSNSGPEC